MAQTLAQRQYIKRKKEFISAEILICDVAINQYPNEIGFLATKR
jgi:hypothetical protein